MIEALSRGVLAAGDALSRLSSGRVSVELQAVAQLTPADIVSQLGAAERPVVGVYVGFEGPVSGHALLLMSPDGAARVSRHLLDGRAAGAVAWPIVTNGEIDPMERSAIEELGNIVISTALNELGREEPRPILPSVPQLVVEMAGAILQSVLVDLAIDADEITVARARFTEAGQPFDGWLLVLPRPSGVRPSMPSPA